MCRNEDRSRDNVRQNNTLRVDVKHARTGAGNVILNNVEFQSMIDQDVFQNSRWCDDTNTRTKHMASVWDSPEKLQGQNACSTTRHQQHKTRLSYHTCVYCNVPLEKEKWCLVAFHWLALIHCTFTRVLYLTIRLLRASFQCVYHIQKTRIAETQQTILMFMLYVYMLMH